MLRTNTLITILVLLFAQITVAQNSGVVPGVIRIKLKPEVVTSTYGISTQATKGQVVTGIKALDKVGAAYSVTSIKRVFPYSPKFEERHIKYGLHLWYEVTYSASTPTKQTADAYSKLTEVEKSEIVHEAVLDNGGGTPRYAPVMATDETRPSTMPFNDPYLPKQWGYNNYGQTGGTPGEDINLFNAWKLTTGTPNVIVSVHDQGVDYKHEDLKGSMWINQLEMNGTKGVDDDGNGYLDDIYGVNFADNTGTINVDYHGTHVAGTIAAQNNNGTGVSGIAGGSGNNDGARIMTCQIMGGSRSVDIPASYVYAADMGALISQNSWGYTTAGYSDEAVLVGIKYFIDEAGNFPGSPMRGGIVFFASGNDYSEALSYPGASPLVIAVDALNSRSSKAQYSNFGTWTDISAPGGDSGDDVELGTSKDYSNSIMSTLENNAYGYLEGTSMACPHVSGIAALIVSKWGGDEFTNTDLKKRILTGVRNIYDLEANKPYIGKLGSGAADAVIALAEDKKIAPDKINDLTLKGIAQDFATLNWTVPADEDDGIPVSFEIIYSKEPITTATLAYAKILTMNNTKAVGELQSFEVNNLLALTQYYFAVRSLDRWGNTSDFSNIIVTTTNSGPTASFDPSKLALTLTIDVRSNTVAADSIKLMNSGAGLLRWDALTRNRLIAPLSVRPALNYPVVQDVNAPKLGVGFDMLNPSILNNIQRDTFIDKGHLDGRYGLTVIGETNTKIPNSSATRFYTGKDRGFNLTFADAYLEVDSTLGPVIFEVFQGPYIEDAKLVFAQEIPKQGKTSNYTGLKLDEQIYFDKDTWFWLVYHVPAGNRFPLGTGVEYNSLASKQCYMSFDVGKSWKLLETVYDNRAVWAVFATEQLVNMNQYLVLSPDSGVVATDEHISIKAQVDGAKLINGTYNSSLVVNTNETGKPMLRVPVNVTVKGHLPVIESQKRSDFGGVLLGKTRDITVTFKNTGLGRFNFATPGVTITDPQFIYAKGLRSIVEAGTSITLTFRFIPTKVGNNFCSVTLLDKDGNKYSFELFGAGLAPPVAQLNPVSATFTDLALGDSIVNTVSLKNTGKYPLDYYLPAFADGKNMESIPTDIAKFGYTYQIDTTGSSYVWNEISNTGKDITSLFNGNYRTNIYTKVPLNFAFPFYGKVTDSVNISKYGLIAFDGNLDYIFSRAPMAYKYNNNPDRYVSGGGFPMKFQEAGFGKIFYRQESNRLIVQYEDVPYYDGKMEEYFDDGSYVDYRASLTFQIVLYDNGNIDLVYKNSELRWMEDWTGVCMEDQTKMDGILFKDHDNPNTTIFNFQPKSVIHIYNPGMGLFTNVTNPYGTILPGDSANIKYTIKTDSLNLLSYSENLVAVTNDPFNNPAIHTVLFNINEGGLPEISVNTNSFDFGTILKGEVKTNTFLVINSGKAVDSIKTATFDHGYYTLTGNVPEIIKPDRKIPYILTIENNTLGLHNDTLRLTTSSGKLIKIALSGEVIQGPILNLQSSSGSALTGITRFLNAGNSTAVNFKINNSGASDLNVAPIRNQWSNIREKDTTANEFRYSYFYKSSNDYGGPDYNWIDLAGQGGTKVTGINSWVENKEWSEPIKLPFKFDFYGNTYDTLYIGYNGIITFTKDQNDYSYLMGGKTIPLAEEPNNYIAPLFGFIMEEWYKKYPLTGIYYKIEADRIIIEYHEYNRASVMGMPISMEVILNADGTIKMQYDLPENSTNYVTGEGIIGIENMDGSDGVLISERQYVVNTDMSFVLYPTRTYAIAPATSKDFIMDLSAKELVAGTYTDSIAFQNNDPLAIDKLLPVKLVVSGTAQIANPDTISFGDVMVNASVKTITKEFEIRNTGTADFVITGSTQSHPETFKLYAFIENKGGDMYWQQIILNTDYAFPQTIQARKSLKMKAEITPSAPAILSDDFVFTTSLAVPEHNIHLGAQIYNPALVNVSQDTITYYAQTEKFQKSHKLTLSNAGGYNLIYTAGIEYLRDSVLTSSLQKQGGVTLSSSAQVLPEVIPVKPSAAYKGQNTGTGTESFNRILVHDTATIASNLIGYGGSRVFYAATGFYAPAQGFNLTHVQTWYAPDDWLNSKIKVEIWSGDEDINSSKLVYSETFDYAIAEPDAIGKLLTFKLSENVEFYPNEKFYVAFGYEAALGHPQGSIQIDNSVYNRYLFGTGSGYEDLSSYSQFKEIGWMIRAAEETASSTPWVVLASADSGNITPSQADTLQLDFDARSVTARHNYAKLLIKSNDVKTPVKEVILHLSKNQGPVFEILKEGLKVTENDTLKFSVTANDLEGDNFTISVDSSYKNLQIIPGKSSTTTQSSGVVSASKSLYLQYTPDFTSQGSQLFSFSATDEFGYTGQTTLSIQVENVNHTPVAIPRDTIRMKPAESFKVFAVADLFTDPDNDIQSISAVSDNTDVINVFASDNYYLLPMTNGKTHITFVATDAYGAVTTNVVQVLVDEKVLGTTDHEMDLFNVYPNPTSDFVEVNIPVEIKDNFTITVINTSGVTVRNQKFSHGDSSVQVDFSKLPAGIYMLKLSDNKTVKTSKIIKH